MLKVVLFLVAAAAGVNGYAKYWWEPAIGVMPDGNPCHAHPERPYYDLTDAEGFFLESPHGIPYHEDGITFEFMDAVTGQLTTTVCPGANYTGQLSLPVLGLALMSMSEGRFRSPAPTPGCRNRVDLGASSSPRAQTSFAFAFAVPCNVTGAVEFRVTAAQRGYPSTWMQSAATLELAPADDCPAQLSLACAGAGTGGSGDTLLDTVDDSGEPTPAGDVPSTTTPGAGPSSEPGGSTDRPSPAELQVDPLEPAASDNGGGGSSSPKPQQAPSASPSPAPAAKRGPKQQQPASKRLSPPPKGTVRAKASPPPGRKSPPPRKTLRR
ncbi:hypothetical protein HXX76_006204 [Chlamydomonas incerta]|uniref:Uncharacterized protein n=1 Tax=Chlamydomonas incerta TaxID=51695 RepID=A0A835W5R4_CHLIN|nr:hypothetical protein HXX76_006204 [Chlamydomonas incerta]|eukprot:KAG2436676.1 hypothetical protein HXX76_006204 [Chlamydomonas incerta]